MKKLLVAAVLFTTPAQAGMYQFYDGSLHIGMPKALDIFNLDWEFTNDPNWQHEVFDCSIKGWVLASFQAWQTNHSPSPPVDAPPVIDPPPPDAAPPIVPCLVGCGPPPILPATPEPSTWVMMVLGFLGLIGIRERIKYVSRY